MSPLQTLSRTTGLAGGIQLDIARAQAHQQAQQFILRLEYLPTPVYPANSALSLAAALTAKHRDRAGLSYTPSDPSHTRSASNNINEQRYPDDPRRRYG
ncbi:hypothetical protein HZU75_09410 [Chitinibacter fontanus]|uniref:Uncharacterized protein n=1 Tax=Chitinibacter fontanus TaxID=1737446 RepID=A0A7D5V9V2_9NEIS|nr:hypothetical protein [Chitinibacter fontanus]QLI81731.1 hypothetical protein HZU75_09410 [Chitinibacter fontanus]